MNAQLPHVPTQLIPDRPTAADTARATGTALMTAASLDELRNRLERLRARTRGEITQRLREARSFGSGSNNDEFHAVREEQMVLEARIASLEETIARAVIVDPAGVERGVAAIGSTVLIEDLDSGTVSRYRLASAHHSLGADTITAASPMGQALIGATPGAIVTVDLPNGRTRRVRLAEVKTEGTPSLRPRAAA